MTKWNIDFTPIELKYTEKYIKRLEKDYHQWPRTRWIILVGSLVIIGISFFAFNQLDNLNELLKGLFSIRSRNFDPKEVEFFVNAQIMKSRFEMYYIIGVGLSTLTAVHWLAYGLINWNRHLKSIIMAKLLSRLISENK